MATIHDIPIFRAGRHNGQDFSEQDIDEILANSNQAMPYILESIKTGAYPGNDIPLTKPIPGLINFAHQRYLTETLREAVSDAAVEFKRQGKWLVATIRNVKQEIADFIKERFPFRSIELIPILTVEGHELRNVIRSIAFLPPDIAPAVSGQSPHLAVEYSADGGIIQLFSQIEEGEKPMAEEKTKQEQEKIPVVSVDELSALKSQVAEMQAKSAKDEQEKNELKARLHLETTKREQNEIAMFCKALETDFAASPAFVELVKPLLERADNHAVVEFAADRKLTVRGELERVFKALLTQKDALTVPIGEFAKQNHEDPSKKEPGQAEKQAEMIAEFAEQAKAKAQNPQDEREVFGIAFDMAVRKYGDALGV